MSADSLLYTCYVQLQ